MLYLSLDKNVLSRIVSLLYKNMDERKRIADDNPIYQRLNRILGEIMYGVEHTIETVPHILLYGHPREFFDSFGEDEWLGRCMEGRLCLKMIQWHTNFPKGIPEEQYQMEELMIKSMKYFVANCSVFEDMKRRSPRQFDLLRWIPPKQYQLPFLLDPSDVAKEEMVGRASFLFGLCERCPLRS